MNFDARIRLIIGDLVVGKAMAESAMGDKDGEIAALRTQIAALTPEPDAPGAASDIDQPPMDEAAQQRELARILNMIKR